MKTMAMKIFLLVLGVSLIMSCSSNTQQQNTLLGAGTGAVVGGAATALVGGRGVAIVAGAVVGALVGGLIGHSMDSSDRANTNAAMTKPTNKPTTWHNNKTGAKYKVVPTSQVMSFNGNSTCRTYMATSTMNGKMTQEDGTMCRGTDGNWQPVKAA